MNKKMAVLCVFGGFFVSDVSSMGSPRTFIPATQNDTTATTPRVCDTFLECGIVKLWPVPKKIISQSQNLGIAESAPQRRCDYLINYSDTAVAQKIHAISPIATIDYSTIVNKKHMFIDPKDIELFLGTFLLLPNCIETGDCNVAREIIEVLIGDMRHDPSEMASVSAMSFSNFYKYMKKRTIDDVVKKNIDLHDFLEALDLTVKYVKFQKIGDTYKTVRLSPISARDERHFKISRSLYRTKNFLGCIGK